MALYQLLLLKFLWGAVEGSYCAYYGYDTYDWSSFPILSIGSIVEIVIGSAVDLSILIGLIKYLCYIREHQLENNRKIYAAPTPVAFVATTSGGYINTAAYPPGAQNTTAYPNGIQTPPAYSPGTQTSYPQYPPPQQQEAPSTK
uniref:Uncharacterized protein LOC111110594 n=1 Tax=Crassostrea virginica TaxID=6565 RepID=A0A8B8BJ52_CRAVI|nr:uncharacterized protein LOC111110594 [Crassostrea virginica]